MNRRLSLAVMLIVGVGLMVLQAGGCDAGSSGAPGADVEKASVSGGGGQILNTHCPIMGNKIDPSNVPSSLTRQYKGQTIGFCCAGCPGEWDKLSIAEKDAKLNTAGK